MPTDHNPQFTTYSEINIVSVDGSGHRILSDNPSFDGSPLPTKNGIFYENGNFTLYSMNYDGSNKSQLYPNILWDQRSFSMDESKILLSSGSFENNSYYNNLYLMNSDGSNLVALAPAKGNYPNPHISPQLDEIVFIRDGSVLTIGVDGSHLQSIRTKTDSSRCWNVFYIDQDRIFYVEQVNTLNSLRLFNKATRQDKLMGFFFGGWSTYGRVLSNGKLVYFDMGVIKVMDINAGSTSSLASGYYASFSSDGSRIVYSNNRTISIMNGDGSNQQQIYTERDSIKSVANPQFSTDNKSIIFMTSYTVMRR
jgi:Tol biopolymer transport system component